jgi:hypothetical protein
MIESGTPPRLRGEWSQIPQGLEAVILKCLKPQREDRYASVLEFTRALLAFAPRGASNLRTSKSRSL